SLPALRTICEMAFHNATLCHFGDLSHHRYSRLTGAAQRVERPSATRRENLASRTIKEMSMWTSRRLAVAGRTALFAAGLAALAGTSALAFDGMSAEQR